MIEQTKNSEVNNNQIAGLPRLLTYQEAAEILAVKPQTFRQWVSKKRILFVKIGAVSGSPRISWNHSYDHPRGDLMNTEKLKSLNQWISQELSSLDHGEILITFKARDRKVVLIEKAKIEKEKPG